MLAIHGVAILAIRLMAIPAADPSQEITMKTVLKTLVATAVLATTGFAVHAAQPDCMGGGMGMGGGRHAMMGGDGPMGHGGPMGMRGRTDPAKMEAFMAKRAELLKGKLKITAAQEGAWTSFIAAMKPPARKAENRPDPAELAKLTTPERIDKMHALRVQHQAERSGAMEQREAAVKTFYAALAPEQQKVFDAEHARMGERRGHFGHGGPGRGPGAAAPKSN
jgi:Spy/CpxP family protein refolding chaperone